MKVFAIASAVLSIFAAVASAQEGVTWTKPNNEPEKGNVITRPGLFEKVPVGKPYTITWVPSTEGTIDIVLYKGPGSNIIPQYALASKIANTGTFVWTPETSFPDTKEGYGIRIIVTSNGQHQWSTQFGFLNPGGANLINTPNPTTSTDNKGLVAETTTSASVPTGNSTSTKSATASASTSASVTVSSNRTTTTTSKASTITTVTTSASTLILTASETEEPSTSTTEEASTTTTASGNAAVATAVSYGMGVIAFAAAGMALL